ncbi:MAG: CinA family protein [Sedimentisphaerales bacterium]|nr:CinA family protein [Sedimentisphaerales bacterium]
MHLNGLLSPTVLFLCTAAILYVGANPSDKPGITSEAKVTRYIIIVTGGELLAGAYADGHTFFLTKTLTPLGLNCVGSMCVNDKEADIQEALGFAAAKADLIIVTGGLGPTANDVTRQALCGFTKIPLEEHPDALREMARRFGTSPAKLRENLRRQAQAPTRGTYLKNRNGTAIGLVFEQPQTTIVALPGPPHELQPMVADELIPYLSRRFGTRKPGCSITLRFVGLGQSQIDQTLKEHVPLPADVTTSSSFEGGRVDFTFSLPDDTPKDRARLEEIKQKIAADLGEHIYAYDQTTLEECVIRQLAERDETIALAEAATGGSLAAALTAADGAGRVLAGAYVAPTEEALGRLLGRSQNAPAGIEGIADAAADKAKSECAVAVGQVRQNGTGAGYVEVAFKLPEGTKSRQLPLQGAAQSARERLVTQLLDQLRRDLASHPTPAL